MVVWATRVVCVVFVLLGMMYAGVQLKEWGKDQAFLRRARLYNEVVEAQRRAAQAQRSANPSKDVSP